MHKALRFTMIALFAAAMAGGCAGILGGTNLKAKAKLEACKVSCDEVRTKCEEKCGEEANKDACKLACGAAKDKCVSECR